MEWTKGGIHAYDYLTDYDLSEAGPIASAGGPCGTISTAPPGDCATPTGSFAFPDFTNVTNYTGAIPGDFFPGGFVQDAPRNIIFYNATVDSIGKYYFGGTPSDRTLNVEVYFNTTATGSVGFFWGGHLASGAANAWTTGMGSASVAGAPYHMSAGHVDGAGGGAEDRSIQNGSICLAPDATITCASGSLACTNLTSSCSADSGAGDYTWTVVGGTINSGQGTSTVNYTATSSDSVIIMLTACNAASGCSDDFCCASDTAVVYVQDNNPPTIAFGADTSVFQCSLAQICVGYTVSDPDGMSGLVETQISGPGTIDTVNNRVCFTPGAAGTYTIVARVTDPCGATDQDTINVTVTLNSPPTIAFDADQNVFQCTPTQICLPYTVSDPNGNGLVETKVSGPGTIDTAGNQVCYTPASSGTSTIIVRVVDPCGAEDRDTINVTVTLNSPPVIAFGADQNVFQCTPTQICLPYTVSDPNGNGLVETKVSGPGTIDTAGNQVCFTPASSGTSTIIVRVVDSCGAEDRDTINVTVTLNSPPVIAFGNDTSIFQCTAAQICVGYTVSDPNGTAKLVETQISGPGTIDTLNNRVCFTPGASGTFTIIAQVADSCGASDRDTINVTVTLNSPPTIALGNDTTVGQCSPAPICVTYTLSDPNGNGLTETLISGPGTIDTANNRVCFTPAGMGSYCIVVRATDPCGATDQDTICVNVTVNNPPTIAFGNDTTIFQCALAQICVPYVVSDPDGNGLVEMLVSGPGTIDTANNRVCFTPGAPGSYTIVAKVTDPCGAEDRDTINVTVTLNSPPVIAFGNDTSVSQCTPAQICVGYTVSDPNGNGLTEMLVSGPGTIDTANNRVCFTPAGEGTFTIIAKVTDPCSAEDRDTISVTVNLNDPPTIAFGADQNVFQCTPAQICVPYVVSDPNGNGLIEALLSGTGTIDTANNQVCFTPAGSGTVTIIAKVTDPCGAEDRDTINVTVTLNSPPVASCPGDEEQTLCGPGQVCVSPFTDSDPNNNITSRTVSLGTLNAGEVCFNAAASGNYTIVYTVTDACGATDKCTTHVQVNISDEPLCPTLSDTSVLICEITQNCFPLGTPSVGQNGFNCQVISGPGAVVGDQWCYTPAGFNDTADVVVRCTDTCGHVCVDSFQVIFYTDSSCLECPVLVLDTLTALSNADVEVCLRVGGASFAWGGFDFLISFDATLLTFSGATPGNFLIDCDWEYFTYRLESMNPGLVRLVAIADMNNSNKHPSCLVPDSGDVIACLHFTTTNDRNLACQSSPIGFWWDDCGDNTISNASGTTLFIAGNAPYTVVNFAGVDLTGLENVGGPPLPCPSDKYTPFPCVHFQGGKVRILCPGEIDDRGDINLNALAYEIADAVLYSNYFIWGSGVLSPTYYEAQIAASDVNGDGVPLTVADLVYLIRVITGDVAPVPDDFNGKVAAVAGAIDIAVEATTGGYVVNTSSEFELGASLFVFRYEGGEVTDVSLAGRASSMKIDYRAQDGELRVLVYDIGRERVAAGEGAVFSISAPEAKVELVSVEAATFDGAALKTNFGEVVPSQFVLYPNYPNPFNPSTSFTMDFPVESEYTLTIYNIAGQMVRTFAGQATPGTLRITWDGRSEGGAQVASGVYFYRLQAGEFNAVRKMVLMK